MSTQYYTQDQPATSQPDTGQQAPASRTPAPAPRSSLAQAGESARVSPAYIVAKGLSLLCGADMISSLRSWPTSCPEESLTCRVASGSSRARRRAIGDRRVTVKSAVPQVHRRLDLAERERPRALDQGEFLHRGARPLPERVSDGFEFDPQGGVRGFRRGGHLAAQGTLPPRRAGQLPPHRRDRDGVERRRVPGEPVHDPDARLLPARSAGPIGPPAAMRATTLTLPAS